MNPPKYPSRIRVAGRERWNVTQRGIVEYAVWQSLHPVTCLELLHVLEKDFGVQAGQVYTTQNLISLTDAKRLVRLKRGLYMHACHATMFD